MTGLRANACLQYPVTLYATNVALAVSIKTRSEYDSALLLNTPEVTVMLPRNWRSTCCTFLFNMTGTENDAAIPVQRACSTPRQREPTCSNAACRAPDHVVVASVIAALGCS